MATTRPSNLKSSLSKTCLQEKTNLYKTTRSRSRKLEDGRILEKSDGRECNIKASGDRGSFSQNPISNSKPNTELKPIDNKTANKVLAAFAKHLEAEQSDKDIDDPNSISTSTYKIEDKHNRRKHGNLNINRKIHNKRIAIISDDHKIAITPNVAVELEREMAESRLQEINVNDNKGFPCTYKLKTDDKKKSKHHPHKPSKRLKEKSRKTDSLFPEIKTDAVDKHHSDKDLNNHYLAIVPASDINLNEDKKDMVYGPFYFVKKSENQAAELVEDTQILSEPQITETSITHFQHSKMSSKTEQYEVKSFLDNNTSKADDDHGKQTLIKQSTKSSLPKTNVQWAFSPRKVEREANIKTEKADRLADTAKLEEIKDKNDEKNDDNYKNVDKKYNKKYDKNEDKNEIYMNSSDSSLSDLVSHTLQSQEENSAMKYMKANVEFLIGVGLNDVKVIGARRMR